MENTAQKKNSYRLVIYVLNNIYVLTFLEDFMEILIAILWYLQLLVPGQTYTTADINAIYQNNQTTVDAVQQDATKTDAALDYFDDTNTDLIEIWEDPIVIPEPLRR